MTVGPCPRCHVGIDDNGDGDCAVCAKFTDPELREIMARGLMTAAPTLRFLYPRGEEERLKPQVRWARLIVCEGSEAQVAHYKAQSVFTTSRKMGGVTCTILDEDDLQMIESSLALKPKSHRTEPAADVS